MTLGDRALLLCPSQYAYGPRGKDTIPGDAFLLFDVHILGVNGEWIDMGGAPEQEADEEENLVSGTSPVVEEVVEKQCACTRELNPVQCANGVTYPNPCTAKCADQTDCVNPREEAARLEKEEQARLAKEEQARHAKEEQARLADEKRLANEEEAREEEEELAEERYAEMKMAAMAVKKLHTEAAMAQEQARDYQAAADMIADEAEIALEAAMILTEQADEAMAAAEQLLNSSLADPSPEYDFERIVKGGKFEFSKAISAPTDLSKFLSETINEDDEQRVCKYWWERNCVRANGERPAAKADLFSGAEQKPSKVVDTEAADQARLNAARIA